MEEPESLQDFFFLIVAKSGNWDRKKIGLSRRKQYKGRECFPGVGVLCFYFLFFKQKGGKECWRKRVSESWVGGTVVEVVDVLRTVL